MVHQIFHNEWRLQPSRKAPAEQTLELSRYASREEIGVRYGVGKFFGGPKGPPLYA